MSTREGGLPALRIESQRLGPAIVCKSSRDCPPHLFKQTEPDKERAQLVPSAPPVSCCINRTCGVDMPKGGDDLSRSAKLFSISEIRTSDCLAVICESSRSYS